MQLLNTLCLTLNVSEWLATTRQPRILHVFDHACNLINERKEVVSIVTPEIGNGPFNLVVETDIFFNEHLSLESPITNSPCQLDLGNLTINTTNAKLWFPHPNWEMLHAEKNKILGRLTTLPIMNYQKLGGFDTPLENRSGLLNHQQVLSTNYQFYISLISSLAVADLFSSLTAAQQLAGLGQGLTPSGDDFIMGALLAAWIIHPPEIARVLADEITRIAAPLTTSLSAAYLKSAGKGEAGILWHSFFNALTTNDSAAIELQITKLLSIGHTSGADALAGFIGTFISRVETETKHVIPKHF